MDRNSKTQSESTNEILLSSARLSIQQVKKNLPKLNIGISNNHEVVLSLQKSLNNIKLELDQINKLINASKKSGERERSDKLKSRYEMFVDWQAQLNKALVSCSFGIKFFEELKDSLLLDVRAKLSDIAGFTDKEEINFMKEDLERLFHDDALKIEDEFLPSIRKMEEVLSGKE